MDAKGATRAQGLIDLKKLQSAQIDEMESIQKTLVRLTKRLNTQVVTFVLVNYGLNDDNIVCI